MRLIYISITPCKFLNRNRRLVVLTKGHTNCLVKNFLGLTKNSLDPRNGGLEGWYIYDLCTSPQFSNNNRFTIAEVGNDRPSGECHKPEFLKFAYWKVFRLLSYGGTVENLNTLYGIVWGAKYDKDISILNILHVKSIEVGKISAHPHPTLCIQFLNRENNDKNNTHILCVCRSFWRFLPFLLVLPSLLFCYKTKMSNNKTTAPIFFSSFLSLWPKYLLPPVTWIFLPWNTPTSIHRFPP